MNIKIGDSVEMPDPRPDDAWSVGGFVARVVDILDSGTAIVEDQDSDFWEIETSRLTPLAD